MMNKRVCVLLAPGYEEVEALTPVDYLRRAGATVDIVSITDDITVESAHHVMVQADTFFADIVPEDYDMVVVPGGVPGVPNLIDNKNVLSFIRTMAENNKWISALCAGPKVLDEAGVLKDKVATCYPTWREKITTAKCVTDETVVTDGNVITACGAGAAGYFALTLVEKLFDNATAMDVKSGVIMDIVEKNLGVN